MEARKHSADVLLLGIFHTPDQTQRTHIVWVPLLAVVVAPFIADHL